MVKLLLCFSSLPHTLFLRGGCENVQQIVKTQYRPVCKHRKKKSREWQSSITGSRTMTLMLPLQISKSLSRPCETEEFRAISSRITNFCLESDPRFPCRLPQPNEKRAPPLRVVGALLVLKPYVKITVQA